MSPQLVPAGRNFPDDINVIIEVPMNSPAIKYEVDKDLERIKWVRTGGWKGVERARQELLDAVSCYQNEPEKPNF